MMTHSYLKKKMLWLVLAILLSALLAACAGKKTVRKDPFFEKWKVMAEKSRGHSPAARPRTIELPEGIKKEAALEEEAKSEKPLPTRKVTLKMHKADVAVVLRALARTVDQNILINAGVKGKISTHIDNAPWEQAFLGILRTQGLTYSWEGDILRIMMLQDMEHDLKIDEIEAKRRAQKIDLKRVEPLLTRVIDIEYADANKLQKNLKEFLTKDEQGESCGSVMVDEHTNAIIIQAIRDDIVRMIPLIEKLDKPTPQILIEAHIVETTRETARELGIQWGGMYRNTSGGENYWITPGGSGGTASLGSAVGGTYSPTDTSGISGQGFGINFPADVATGGASLGLMYGMLGGNILDLQLSALQEEGKLNILSSPSITTLDNQTAAIESGTEVPIQKMEIVEGVGGVDIEYKKAVLELEVTPHVIHGGALKLSLVAKKDELDFTQQVQGYPTIQTKRAETTLILKDGETAVIAGLSKETKSASHSGVPGLKNIPILGWLFKGKSKDEKLEDLLIFITPHILKKQVMSEVQEPGKQLEVPSLSDE